MTQNMFLNKNEHCSYCGGLFLEGKFPKTCLICNNVSYLNPLPVSVVLIKVIKNSGRFEKSGILIIRRNIEPKLGEWALPGGFIELGETWQEASIRETKEEVGLIIDPSDLNFLDIKNANNGNMLIFSFCSTEIWWEDINFIPNREVSEIKISYGLDDLAFPTHNQVMEDFFLKYSSNNF